ncbi:MULTISPECIES: NAD(P)H-dependent glycerol-3-phosphate dehydrogenase [Micrococcaceae]|uniref:NAD(P)H-dependent glycerol-3-phosphate dehydrogenase n=1 Tax=Micrococcaceae TaxID=1268 RepID=UPI00179A7D9D|nr:MULTISPECIES: NAD(P)H-dependent glycerol-3-phosphate dehydrogenase [Micrococcaceae]MBB5748437.1 glycerol-3-phosphate dehydrogenase (NAD(P)+) [Micrococcus sp. TA1]HRO93619.1 NAD(P)H-dependent glycerol-3-phosphate dehydrogenase [Citricoccus sp.]
MTGSRTPGGPPVAADRAPAGPAPETPRSERIAVVGAGSWGTTFAKVLADSAAERGLADPEIVLWARRPDVAAGINAAHRNPDYLPDIDLPEALTATTDLAAAVAGAGMVVLAIPAQEVRGHLPEIRAHLAPDAVVVSLVKGLERGSDARMSELCAEGLGLAADRFAVVSGPNLALEIAREEPTATVVASASPGTAAWVAERVYGPYFRPYTNTDVVGVEICGVVKNVIALAVGICDGQGLGDNSKASIITRGLAETSRLAVRLGGRAETLSGLAGLGDLVATCASPLSRNRSAGRLLGQGLDVAATTARLRQTAEGMKSVSAVVDLARRHGVEMPISEAINAVIAGRLDVDTLAGLLLARDLKPEGRH